MTAAISYSLFHQWLISDPVSRDAACAIVLHMANPVSGLCLITSIADYLNEYDDEGEGSWLPATPEFVAKVCSDANYRQFLSIPDSPTDLDPHLKALEAMGRRGRVVFVSPRDGDLDLPNTFQAGIGQPTRISQKCHLILNPDLIAPQCVARIIGDVYLEWFHCFRRGGSLHQFE